MRHGCIEIRVTINLLLAPANWKENALLVENGFLVGNGSAPLHPFRNVLVTPLTSHWSKNKVSFQRLQYYFEWMRSYLDKLLPRSTSRICFSKYLQVNPIRPCRKISIYWMTLMVWGKNKECTFSFNNWIIFSWLLWWLGSSIQG